MEGGDLEVGMEEGKGRDEGGIPLEEVAGLQK